ncbi:MAG: hypothetical protein CVU38_03770 [Chloroflexi bacterium HGW-Chloroflexi-1]|nr:MAG: hypothetical protein CVU38_03770 [Chloroflexi bacterium HGW-Chloroflexi-1]
MSNRLYRSRDDKMIAGVCGGLAEYLRIDATLVRLLFLVLGIASGIGLPVYLIMWVIVPYQGEGVAGFPDTVRTGADEISARARNMGEEMREALSAPNPQAGILIGGALIFFGVVALLRSLDIPWLSWFRFSVLWPALLILAGAVLIWRLITDSRSR